MQLTGLRKAAIVCSLQEFKKFDFLQLKGS
jgi:hypothetical protein